MRQGLNEHLLLALLPDAARRLADDGPLRELLAAGDFTGLAAFFRSLFAGIPHQWHVNNNLEDYEGYYASVLYSCFAAQGFELIVEDSSAGGRADMVVRFNGSVYVFEFKVANTAAEAKLQVQAALAQMRTRGYADKYRQPNRPIHLLGVAFSRESRNLAAFEAERAA